jgi:hypothetical protein
VGYGDELRFRDCPWCGLRDADFRLLNANVNSPRPGGITEFWSFLACPRCGKVVALRTNPANQSPPRVEFVVPEGPRILSIDHLPANVELHYKNAVRALDAGLPDSAAVELGRALEAAAVHFGVNQGALGTRIKTLIDKGLVTKPFGDVMAHVRELRNIGAHASSVGVDEAAVRRALNFTTQVLRNLFEIPGELRAIEKEAPNEAEEKDSSE